MCLAAGSGGLGGTAVGWRRLDGGCCIHALGVIGAYSQASPGNIQGLPSLQMVEGSLGLEQHGRVGITLPSIVLTDVVLIFHPVLAHTVLIFYPVFKVLSVLVLHKENRQVLMQTKLARNGLELP